MFVKIEDYYLNTEQIVSLEPQGKAFRVNLCNGAFLVLNLKDYLVLIKAMKIKESSKLVKEMSPPIEVFMPKIFPAATDKAKLQRTAGKGVEAKQLKDERLAKAQAGEKPKTKLIKKVKNKK